MQFACAGFCSSNFTGITSGVVDSGGGRSASADYELVGSAGQSVAPGAPVESADYVLYPGYVGQLQNFAPSAEPVLTELGADGVAIADLAGLIQDPDYDELSLEAPAGTTTGGAISRIAAVLKYKVGPSFRGGDMFDYSVTDGSYRSGGSVRVVDLQPPVISGAFAPMFVGAGSSGFGVVPDYKSQAIVKDNAGTVVSFSQSPSPGALAALGPLKVALTATDAAGNAAAQYIAATVMALPQIAGHPASVSVSLGGSAVFDVFVSGSVSVSYQWRRNGVPIVGATSATYSIASVQVAQTGDYDVVVSNAAGSVTSNVAKLTIPSGVSIVTQPLAQSANLEAAVTLTVAAAGPGPITYQWRRNGVAIKGATAASYRIASLLTTTEGLYDVVVTNPSGSLASAQAAVSLNKAVAITKAPVTVEVNPGAAAGFSVAVSGTEPITYQWRKGTVAIPGATAAAFQIASAKSADAASYSVVVENAAGSVTSSAAALSLNNAVSITTHPVGGGVNSGAGRTLSVVATGTAPLTYQWRRNGAPVPGATQSSYQIVSAQASNTGVYDVQVGNVVGTVTSGTAVVTLNAPPTIVTQPVNLVVNPGKGASFSVVAGGTAPFTYQWRKNGVNIAGAVAATYTLASAQAASAGVYDVVVKNAAGSATSTSATLGVNTPVSIVTQPAALTVNPGGEAVFKVTAAGTAPLTYQWRKGGIALAGGTGASYAIRSAQGSDAGSYDVVVANMVASALYH